MKRKKEEYKPSSATQEISDVREKDNKFNMHPQNWATTTPEYKNLTEFDNFPSYIEATISKIVSKNPEIDECNRNLLDYCIADIVRKNIDYLKQQSIIHQNMINKIVRQAKGNEMSLRFHLKSVTASYEKAKAEYEDLLDRYNTAIYKDNKSTKTKEENLT